MSFVKNVLFVLFASSLMVCAAENLATLHVSPRDGDADQSASMNMISRTRLLLTLNSELKQTSWLASKAKFTDRKIIDFTYNSEKATEKEIKALFSTASLTIHKRHPDNNNLVEKIATGEAQPPEGYKLCKLDIKDGEGQVQGQRSLLVTEKPALTEKDIKAAWSDRSTNTGVNIELNDEGAKKMEALTKSLKSREDHIVTLLDGKAINDAVLMAEVLSKHFAISGLDNLKECETLVKRITPRFDYKIKILSIKPVEQSIKEK